MMNVMKRSVIVSLDDDINNSTYAPYGYTKFDALNVDNRRNEKYDYFYIKTRYKDNNPISEDNNDAIKLINILLSIFYLCLNYKNLNQNLRLITFIVIIRLFKYFISCWSRNCALYKQS